MCNKYGPMVVGALAISNNICGIATSPINSFEEGESTIVSQNLGNNNEKRALKSFFITFILATIIGFIGYILIRFILQPYLIEIFSKTKSTNGLMSGEEFMTLIKSINDYDCLSIPALAINAAVLGLLYGYKETKLTMIINISRVFLFRIPTLWYLQTFYPEMGEECAGISMGVSNVLITVMSIIILVIFLNNLKKKKLFKKKNKSEIVILNKTSSMIEVEIKIDRF